MLRGEPGVGKSMIAAAIAEATGYDLSMVDVPNLDLGDVAMPVIDHEHKVTRYYPNARFGLTTGKPVVICLDEFTKGADPVKNILHPMLEVFRPRLGDLAIPDGSIIFMTGNMDTDGVGDGLAQHTRQRVVELVVRKSNATEWLQWAAANGIHPVVMAWVDRYPQALSVIPRWRSSMSLYSTLLTRIITSPDTAMIPDDSGARAVLTFGLLEHVEKSTLSNIMKYLRRMEEEFQVIFCVTLARHATKKQIAFTNPDFALWAADNEDLL
jgi:hypothetical protein